MSPKMLFSVVLLILLVDISVVKSETTPQPDDNQGTDSEGRVQNQREYEIRAEDQRKINDILKYLKNMRKFEDNFRVFDKNLQDKVDKEQSLKDQMQLDKIESQMLELIDDLLKVHKNQLPFNTEYNLQVIMLYKYYQDILALLERIYIRRTPEIRSNDLIQSQFIQQKLNTRRESEQRFSVAEQPPKDKNAEKQRSVEQEQLKYVDQKLQNRLRRIEKWHANNRSLNEEYNVLLQSIKRNYKYFIIITSQIDQRRMQERRSEGEEISKIKEYLDSHRRYELDQRIQEKPANSAMLLQRKKDEFIEDRLDKWIRRRIIMMEQQLAKNNILDKNYAHQKDLLNQEFEKLIIHIKKVELRRTQELKE